MPSRAEQVRRRIEWAVRAAALALLAWALWREVSPPPAGARVIDSAALGGALGDLLVGDGAAHLRLRGAVTPTERDAVGAARRAGARVSWSDDSALVWAAAAVPERGPGGMVRVGVVGAGECRGTGTVGDRGTGTVEDGGRGTVEDGGRGTVRDRGTGTVECAATGVLRDTLGVIDTVALRDGGATTMLSPGRGLRFAAPQTMIALAVPPRDTLPWRALVLARAGWEAKFVMAALEEGGWAVSARLVVAPGAEVTQGAVLARNDPSPVPSSSARSMLSSERFDVIVVLDSARAGPDAAAITRFVRGGGGVVLAGEGASALPDLAPARALGPSRPPRSDAVVTREVLALRALASVRADAVVLESRDRTVAVAARVEGRGRVVQVGYDDTWRWRMQGGETAVADHRTFWARALSGAAPDRGVLPAAPEGAPRARLVDAWGSMGAAPGGTNGNPNRRWLWPLVAFMLVAEWASRRTRGAA